MWKEMLEWLSAIIIGYVCFIVFHDNYKINILEEKVKELEYITYNK